MTSQQDQKAQRDLRILSLLRSAEITKDMETEHLRKMVATAREAEIPANKVIYRRGDAGQAIYLVEEGEVIIEMDVPNEGLLRMTTVKPLEFFGWSALFPSERKQAWTRTVKPTKVIVFDAAKLRAACNSDQKFEYSLVRRAIENTAHRLKVTRKELAELLEQKKN